MLSTASRACAQIIGDAALVRLADDDGMLRLATVYHPDAEVRELLIQTVGSHQQHVTEGISGVLMRTGQPVRQELSLEQLRGRAEAPFRPLVERLGVHSGLAVPLIIESRYLGYQATFRMTGSSPFSDADMNLAVDVASRVALAVTVAQSVERLRASEDRYRTIVETASEGIAQVDLHGNLIFANARLAGILGVAADELVGQPVIRFVRQQDRADYADWLADRSRQPGEHEKMLVRADGQEIWVHASAVPTRDAQGQVTGVLSLVTDITDRVRAEQLSQQLEQMRRLDSLGQLAGGVAHDFNNLLAIIGGFAELLREDLTTAERDEATAQISTAVDKGAAITAQLMAFGRGRPPTSAATDIASVITEAQGLLRQAAGDLVTVTFDLPGEPACVSVDSGLIEQILVNLVVNARDAMPTGGLLQIACRPPADNGLESELTTPVGAYVMIAVTDTGHGMDEATRQRVFEPFFTTKPAGQGTGFGLAGVYGIVNAADGHVRVESSLGVGTTVSILLPAATPSGTVATPAPPVQADVVPARVLVVEDNPVIVGLIQRLLIDTGFQVTVAGDIEQALAMVRDGLRPEVLLTDVVMPTMTGPELAAAVRFHEPAVGVVYISGYPAGALERSGRFETDGPLLEKPFRREELVAALDRAYQDRPASAGPPATDAVSPPAQGPPARRNSLK